MPSPLPSSFASAAAGNSHDGAGRRDASGSSDWSRSRPNGATQTFRRPSSNNQSHNRETSQSSAGTYVPPHVTSGHRAGTSNDTRYSKDQLLGIYKAQKETGNLNRNLSELFLGRWDPTESRNGVATSWGRREEAKDQPAGPDICWEASGAVQPVGLSEPTDEEKELFTTSVNSPLKAPTSTKESTPGIGNRKTSFSQNGQYSAGRPGIRRRETGESISTANPLSPTVTRFSRDDSTTSTPPAALLRRKTDHKDSGSDPRPSAKVKEEQVASDTGSPFDSLKRRATGGPLSASLNGPESPWAATPHSATFGTMGAFGSFSLGSGSGNIDPPEKEKRTGFGSMRGESRFKGLLSKGSSEDMHLNPDKQATTGLGRLPEDGAIESTSGWDMGHLRQPRELEGMFEGMSGGLKGSPEPEPPGQPIGDIGFSAFGDSIRNLVASHPSTQHQPSQLHQEMHESMSPTITNPYHVSDGGLHGDDELHGFSEGRRTNFSALGALREDSSADAFGSLRGKIGSTTFDDRSQTSSTGPSRMFPTFGGLGGLPNVGGPSPWAATTVGGSGTPTKERLPSAFGDSMFGSMGDFQSSNLGQGAGIFGPSTSGSFRSGKIGSLLPQAMQDQMKARPGSAGDGFGSIRSSGDQQTFGNPNIFGDVDSQLHRDSEESSIHEHNYPFGPSSGFSPTPGSGLLSQVGTADNQSQNLNQGGGGSNQLSTAQQRQMVMPDRMRWIYRDPQGNTQGPWSGLEMHDWFKAGFFTAELQVKKLEDTEFEPLAQLVRRIGNSREPFLVPQIGVPHGPAPPSSGNSWAASAGHVSGGVPQGGGTQPPFANSFPSFGTTLTAEQQNALERRKQEEQYLMARQKEHLAQQQMLMKQMGMQSGAMHHNLQHHSSAHSLHSQPSFGSIASPSGYQPSPIQGPIQPPPSTAGFADSVPPFRPNISSGASGAANEVDDFPPFFERMNLNRGQVPFAGPVGGRVPEGPPQQPIGNALQDRARLQAEQQQQSSSGDFLPEFQTGDRLQQFHSLRQDLNLDFPHGLSNLGDLPESEGPAEATTYEQTFKAVYGSPEPEMLSLSEQAQSVAAAQRPLPPIRTHKTEQPEISPPQSSSPLPAPAAQRRQNVADSLVAEPRSQSQTPIETPSTSVAPWADKTSEPPRGPSLKEIQEAEAKKAAKQGELAAAARRAQVELERQQAAAVIAPAPGLPLTSTWANPASPATPTAPGSVWSKTTTKPVIAAAPSSSKKTLAQIQKEEEARKRAANVAAAAQAASIAGTSAAGKRYAELASKIGPVTPTAGSSGAWTTVGSGGKVKAPATVVASPGAAQRTVSSGIATQAKAKPAAAASARAPGATVVPQSISQTKATDELVKWAKVQLGKGLSSNINVDEFVQSLLILPTEAEIISDSVYANSQTLDGRRFAEEFVRKRKLADKGVIDGGASSNGSTPVDNKSIGTAGGWNEVAKKGPEKKESGSGNSVFKVVAGKKKGKR